MRIVGLEEFLKLPPGTLYMKSDEYGNPDGFMVKEATWGNDWVYRDLQDIDNASSEDRMDRLFAMIADSSISYPINEDCGRDGMFEPSQRFFVYERADLESLAAAMARALSVTPPIS